MSEDVPPPYMLQIDDTTYKSILYHCFFADNKMLNSSFSIIVQADTIQLHLLLPMAYEDIYLLLGLILLQGAH